MSEVKVTFGTSRLPGADQLVDRLPPVLRIQSIARFPFDERHMLCQAVLFHEQAGLKVEWLCRQPDNRLTAGALVSRCPGASTLAGTLWQRSQESARPMRSGRVVSRWRWCAPNPGDPG